VFREIIEDLRAGNPLYKALDKHPKIFSMLCRQSLRVGEQAGGMESILRQMADYMQRELNATKGIKSALTYPAIAAIACVIVVGVLVGFVLPAFGNLYNSLGAELPAMTRILIDVSTSFQKYMLHIVVGVLAMVTGFVIYIRTPKGRYQLDRLTLKLPIVGRITHFKELSRCCRSISLLFHAGLPITEIMPLVISSVGNKAIVKALSDVQEDMFKGEGLSKPMTKNELFLPMMVQRVKVGEETGNLDVTLMAVAESYETEAKDKTDSLVSLIQPTMTIVIGGIIGLIALSMVSAMYSIYGKAF
jgi:type IV pilus assembly protein PilC